MTNSPVRSRTRSRLWQLTLSSAVAATVVGSSATAWAATTGPEPVKANPTVDEVAPAAHGRWFGWSQNSATNPDTHDFFVQKGDGAKVRVNTPDTQGLGGDVVAGRVIYAQRYGDRDPRINVFDPATGTRTALPDKVNHRYQRGTYPGQGTRKVRYLATVLGDVSASGPWVLYTGVERLDPMPRDGSYDNDTVMLYNRRTGALKKLDEALDDWTDVSAGQVDGRWAAYRVAVAGDDLAGVYRYDIRTGEQEPAYPDRFFDRVLSSPAVAADGTTYFFQRESDCGETTCTWGLYRWPVGGSAPESIATLTTPLQTWFDDLRVKDLPDGRRSVYYSEAASSGSATATDIFRIVDDPSATAISAQD